MNKFVATDGKTLGFVHRSSANWLKSLPSFMRKYSWKIVEYQENDDKTSFKTRNLIMPWFGSQLSSPLYTIKWSL